MFTTYFSSNQVLSLLFIALLHFISIYYFTLKKNIKQAMFFLFAGGLTARLVIICFDNYLHLWDEQYHALAAKNMAENPFVPMLFKYAPLGFDHFDWTACHIWLHKQPLFLWQMALSIKLFGATPFAVRLPSAIMTSLLIPVIFRMGKLSVNARVGYLASFLFAVCNYLLDFNTGQYNTDHNDIAFIFYVTLSIWAYTEYCVDKKSQYIWLIGFFAGLAILNKWLTGLVVFSGWGVALLFIHGTANKISEFKKLLKAFVICVLTFLPWQIYKAIRFPVESAVEYKYYALHFTEPLDGHSGNMWYHFNQAIEQYGQVAAYVLPIALIILFRDIKNISHRVSFITYVVVVYLFFTISKTKMPAFCLIVSPILFLSLGNLLNKVIEQICQIKINKYLLNSTEFLLLIVIGIASFNIEKLQANHTDWIKNDARAWCNKNIMRATEFGKLIKGKYDEKKTLIVNCKETDNIPIMFFSGYTAYSRNPNLEEYTVLKKNGYKILYLDDFSPIPEYLATDPNVSFINYFGKNKSIHLKTINDKYVCADRATNNFVVAKKDSASECETLSLLQLENNECAFRAYDKHFLCAELNHQNEITATREKIGPWETFTMVKLENNFVALKAANGKYLHVDEETFQIYALGDSIGKQEKFQIVEK
jgi:4-amino-4-deoxy-L-arabinose transferase